MRPGDADRRQGGIIMRDKITATIFMAVLLAAGPAAAGSPCGDVNKTGTVTSSDALSVLKFAVGQSITLLCDPSGGILKTGQTKCYNTAGAEISCAGTGQDGQTGLGAARSFTDNGNGTVTDATTALVWEKLSDDGSIHDKDNKYTWLEAVTVKIAGLNAANFAGHDDWRLPNRFELDSLVNLGASGPSTYPPFHTSCAASCTVTSCSCTRPDYYWTSSTYVGSASYAWTVYFAAGDAFSGMKPTAYYVRAVRGGV
ncbi:MAG: DUF1566 domain-containing protein [Candidatus Binatia bacterium]